MQSAWSGPEPQATSTVMPVGGNILQQRAGHSLRLLWSAWSTPFMLCGRDPSSTTVSIPAWTL